MDCGAAGMVSKLKHDKNRKFVNLNSSLPSDAYMQWTGSASAQAMASSLFGANPLP